MTLSNFVRCCYGKLCPHTITCPISTHAHIPGHEIFLLPSTNMEDLREKTHSQHYELYRQSRLQQMGFADKTADNRPVSLQETYEIKRQQHLRDMQTKEERMRQMFVQKVKFVAVYSDPYVVCIYMYMVVDQHMCGWIDLTLHVTNSPPLSLCCVQVKDKEAELKSAEQRLHDEFERLRQQNAEEKRLIDDKKRQMVSKLFSYD